MKTIIPSEENSGAPENGTPQRLEDDPWAVLALVDLICFYVDEKPPIYS